MATKVFQSRKVQKAFPYKIASGDYFNDFIYLGDEKGNMYKYPIKSDDSQIMQTNSKDEPRPIGSKSKIDKIITYVETNSILALSDQKLYVIDSALNKSQMIKDKVIDFAINQSFGAPCNHGIVVVTKKQGTIFNYNANLRKFEQLKQKQQKFGLDEAPACLGYTKNFIILGLKKQYQILNISQNFAKKKIQLEVKGNPFFKVTGRDQIIFFQDNIGIFMSPQAFPKERNPIVIDNIKGLLDIGLSNNFCFIVMENSVQIFNTFDPKQYISVQKININACRGVTNGRVFVYTKDDLTYLYQIPFELQISSLLAKCDVNGALNVLKQNVGQNQMMINQLKLDAIWPLLKKLNFEKAKDLMKEIDFDIRQLIALYPQYLNLSNQNVMKPQKTLSLFISQNIQERQLKKDQSQRQMSEAKKRARLFLKEILEFKRQKYIIQNTKHMKQKITYPTSKGSLVGIRMQAVTMQEILQIVDFALIKWYIDANSFKNLEQFFSNNIKIYCRNLFNQFENEFRSGKLKEYITLIPRFYASFGKIDLALQSWRRVSENKDQARAQIACQQAVKLLAKIEDRQKVMQDLKWILKRKPEVGMTLFTILPQNFLYSDQVIKYFENDQNQNVRNCLERYLQILVLQKQTQQERLHTKLITKYLENLFKVKRKDSKQEINTPQFNQKLSKMKLFLRNQLAKYATEVVIDRIKGCQWLLEDQIYLYSREKKHDEALQKLIQKQLFKDAQRYCEQNQDRTLTKYFTKLIKLYQKYQTQGNNSSLMIKKDIMTFLRKYANHAELDPIQVMQLVPSDWMLNDDSVGGLYEFLESAISHTLHQKRSLNTAKYLSQMDLLNVEYSLAKTKQASVRFTYTKKCKVCHKPIADKIFVVFPNAVVCHQACIKKQKSTICPLTGQQFQKTFKN